MESLPKSVNNLINQFANLPGIGKKTAQRLAFHVLKSEEYIPLSLAKAIEDVKKNIIFCEKCHGITEKSPCLICENDDRNEKLICVVADAQDVFTFEKTRSYDGKYHVLGGVLSPLDGVGPDDLNFISLTKKLKNGVEIIIATNSSIEGETTSLYLSKLLSNYENIKVTRLARGLPVGGNIEYIDEATLIRAMEERTSI